MAKRRNRQKRQSSTKPTRSGPKMPPIQGELVETNQLPIESEFTDRQFRTTAYLLSLGVVPEQRARKVLEKGYEHAENSDNAESYAAAMRVLLTAAKIKQADEKMHKSPLSVHLHKHEQTNGTNTGSDLRATLLANARDGGNSR